MAISISSASTIKVTDEDSGFTLNYKSDEMFPITLSNKYNDSITQMNMDDLKSLSEIINRMLNNLED